MKYVALILTFALAGSVYAGTTPISQSHHVSGSAGFIEIDSYNLSGALPISGSATDTMAIRTPKLLQFTPGLLPRRSGACGARTRRALPRDPDGPSPARAWG